MQKNFLKDNYKKINEITNKFSGFPDIDRIKIQIWFDNFEKEHQSLALKVLDNIIYFDESKIHQSSVNILNQIKNLKNNNLSKVFFCNLGGPGKSGEHMKYPFKVANNLSESNFIYLSDIKSLCVEEDITVVFLDDFIGTGNQIIAQWNKVRGDIVPDNVEVFCGVVAGFKNGITNINQNTPIKVLCHKYLSDEDMLFSDKNTTFNNKEKKILKEYCNKTGVTETEAYGKCQALVVFSHRTPNNTLPIIGAKNPRWKGLFPRYPRNQE